MRQYICANASGASRLVFGGAEKNACLVCPMAAVLPLGHLVKFKKRNIMGGDVLETNKQEAFTGSQPLYFTAGAAYALCLVADNSTECQISTFGPLFPVFTSPVQ